MTRIFSIAAISLAMVDRANSQGVAFNALTDLQGGSTAGSIIQLFGLFTVLALVPGVLIAVTSFTRFIIIASILRSGIGLQTTPANIILISLSLFLTFYVMAPVFDKSWKDGLQPLLEKKISETDAFPKIAEPFRSFMLNNVRDKDLKLFVDLAEERGIVTVGEDAVPYQVLVPAFMISEMRRGFEIGFLVILPFLVIDLVVATVTMAMGMMMLPPTVIALPLKIMFFVLIDGWHLLAGSMVRSFN
jgi:flagellar biosynthesis protein FliP